MEPWAIGAEPERFSRSSPDASCPSGHHFSLLSSLARSRAPRLVRPALSREDCWLRLAMASCWSALSLALTDSWMLRVLRSTFTTTAETSSPSFSTLRASSTRSRLISLARR
eukprot:Amastigsp_a340090_4.p3 type:complete len:112 gc:universal Amastigsp_a340090_4:113-448(+)